MVTPFPGVLLPFDFLDELRAIWASGNVRPDAFILVAKDLDGNVAAMEGGSLEEQADAVEINAVLAALCSRGRGATRFTVRARTRTSARRSRPRTSGRPWRR